MATKKGVYQLDSGMWAYRFSILVDGKRISRKKTTDASGNKLRTQAAASKSREAAIMNARIERKHQVKISRRTIKEVFDEYVEKGRAGKAYKTY